MIAPRLGGKTFGQVDKIAAQAAVTVDPGPGGASPRARRAEPRPV